MKKELHLFSRLKKSFSFSKNEKRKRIFWIHAVSLGETKAASGLIEKINKEYKDLDLIFSSITKTGHEEAKKSYPQAKHIYLPFDFSFLMKRVLKGIQPDLVLVVETDLWYHFLKYAKKNGAKIVLVSGKMSKRSSKRLAKLSFFAKRLFSFFDQICVQNELYKKRFLLAHANKNKIHVTGNLKFDAPKNHLSLDEKNSWKKKLFLQKSSVITIASTHFPEEKMLLKSLEKVWEKEESVKILLAPRHPERFKQVENLLVERKMPFAKFSRLEPFLGSERVILIDAMGVLSHCFQISDVAIVAGSFIDNIGGHNIFEPISYGVTTFFGPHMFGQKDMTNLALEYACGIQKPIEDLPLAILSYLQDAKKRQKVEKNCLSLSAFLSGTVDRTFQIITAKHS